MNRAELERRAQLWRRHRAWHAAWVSAAVALAAACLVVRISVGGAVVAGIASAVCVSIWLLRRVPPVTSTQVAAHLNRICPTLEESAALWLREVAALTLVERLQLRRLEAAWTALAERATPGCPRAGTLRPAVGCTVSAAVGLTLVAGWPRAGAPLVHAPSIAIRPAVAVQPAVAPALRAASLTIEPPAYLGKAQHGVAGLDAEVPEGSVVTWDIEISGAIAGLTVEGTGAKEHVSAVALGGGRFRARATIADTRLYQLALTLADGARLRWPEIHTLKVIRDQPPRLTWQEPAGSRTIVDPAGGRPFARVRLEAADDHGIAEVTLVMAVAKGAGESVKFREWAIALERTTGAPAGREAFGTVLDLGALGMEPGDELYFHALAADRREPAPNRTRSETRFVILRGPETTLAEPGLAMAGLNRVPNYFRSQRQLIMDTEKLLVERPALTEEKFRETAEEIGIDQKLLRLRYGQFLGEEFEPPSEGAPKEAQAMALARAIRGQSRASAGRTAAVERAVEAQHAHPVPTTGAGLPPTMQNVAGPLVHQHDNAEAATLFDAQVKASLRAVLGAMWEAEGFLRTGRPAEALPAEHRALELLKELQQADRVYVKRVGYEPTPIAIAERRLRGELDAIPKRALGGLTRPDAKADEVALTAALTASGDATWAQISAEQSAGVEARLIAAAEETPESFVPVLELWRRRASALGGQERAMLQRALWSLLPPAQAMPQRRVEPAPGLARDYFEAIQAAGGAAR